MMALFVAKRAILPIRIFALTWMCQNETSSSFCELACSVAKWTCYGSPCAQSAYALAYCATLVLLRLFEFIKSVEPIHTRLSIRKINCDYLRVSMKISVETIQEKEGTGPVPFFLSACKPERKRETSTGICSCGFNNFGIRSNRHALRSNDSLGFSCLQMSCCTFRI